MSTQEQLEERLAKAQEELAQAQAAVKARQELTPAQALAVDLHEQQCYSKGAMEDAWGWEKGWALGEHQAYLKKAEKMLAVTDIITIRKVLKIYNGH
jgi:hypothetical protein